MNSLGPLFILLGIVAAIGVTVEVLLRRSLRRRSMLLKAQVRIDGVKVPARVDPRTGVVHPGVSVRPGQVVEISYITAKDP